MPRYVYYLLLCFQHLAEPLAFWALFLRVRSFVFNILQTLLQKYRGVTNVFQETPRLREAPGNPYV
jgi:hypothetical protein